MSRFFCVQCSLAGVLKGILQQKLRLRYSERRNRDFVVAYGIFTMRLKDSSQQKNMLAVYLHCDKGYTTTETALTVS